MARTATLAHRAELLDDHMCDSNWKKLLDMVPFLCRKYVTAVDMREAAMQYFAERSVGISAELLSNWEAEITNAERLRERDRKAMDILKARTFDALTSNSGILAACEDGLGTETGGPMTDNDSFWIQLGLDIEEQQIAIQDQVRRLNRHPREDERRKVEAERELLRIKLNILAASQARGGYVSGRRRTTLPEADDVLGAFDDDGELGEDGLLPDQPADLSASTELLEPDLAAPESFAISFPSTLIAGASPLSMIEYHLRQGKKAKP
ncbi:hypothetical protein C0992_008484 [Termitomyces sp. T32_za158]|nr:hypothetical protein C0992_008484 [Termitomyces sp. T32_za158]